MSKTWDELENDSNDTSRKQALAVVCGLPDSGNRMLTKMLQDCGFDATILHGTPELPEDDPDYSKSLRRSAERLRRIHRPGRTFAVFITRTPEYRAVSYGAKTLYQWHHRWTDTEHLHLMMCVLVELHVPTLIVPYEGVVERPVGSIQYIVEGVKASKWLTCETPGYHLPSHLASIPKDANAKYRRKK